MGLTDLNSELSEGYNTLMFCSMNVLLLKNSIRTKYFYFAPEPLIQNAFFSAL